MLMMRKCKYEEHLTPEQEDELLEWFKANPIFYDQSRRDFKEKRKRDRLLVEKGKEMGISGEHKLSTFLISRLPCFHVECKHRR